MALPFAPAASTSKMAPIHHEPLTPAGSVDGADTSAEFVFPPKREREDSVKEPGASEEHEPPKKKRRIALTRVGDVGT